MPDLSLELSALLAVCERRGDHHHNQYIEHLRKRQYATAHEHQAMRSAFDHIAQLIRLGRYLPIEQADAEAQFDLLEAA